MYEKALKMYDEAKTVPDFTAHPPGMAWLKIPGWLRPNATPNVIVTLNENGELWPSIVDVGFIKNPPIMRQVHERMLAQSILREYQKLENQQR